MRWENRRRSQNVEDRRSAGGSRRVAGGAVGGIGVLIVALIIFLLGGDPLAFLQGVGEVQQQQQVPAVNPLTPEQEQLKEFVSVVLADTEDVWHELFRQQGKRYQEPKLVLFNGFVDSACGRATASVGPFYCPADRTVYIDLSFYEELRKRHRAPGDFAQAYVIAHEIGHHVQNLLGISDEVHRLQQQSSKREANDLSVRLELQADFLAGVWAHHAQRMRNMLEEGDIEEALNAAAAIGDDRLQREARGYVTPDSFTHGSSEQRVRWFRKGLASGKISDGDTFSIQRP